MGWLRYSDRFHREQCRRGSRDPRAHASRTNFLFRAGRGMKGLTFAGLPRERTSKLMTTRIFLSVILIALFFGYRTEGNAETIQVNSSSALQQALNNVSDGGTVEIAAGTYSAPSGGFTIYAPKGFIVRA